MCTAATYRTKDFYFGRTLDYECNYGEEVTITPRNYPFAFRHMGEMKTHYAIIGHMWQQITRFIMMPSMKKVLEWQDLTLLATLNIRR